MRRGLLPSKPFGFGNTGKFSSSPEAPSPGELAHEVRLKELLPQPLIASGGPEGANGLEDLHQQHQQDDTDDHNVGLVAVVAVGKGDLAQA